MNQLSPAAAQQQIVATVRRLAQPAVTHPIVVSGDEALCAALQADGLCAVTVAACPVGRGQHTLGIVAGARSRAALAAAIAGMAPYLAEAATMVVLIADSCGGLGPQAGSLLAPFGFRIEAGVRCQRGLLLSAHRDAAAAMAVAA
ncbi:MAG: hypothetical protein AB1586_03110 [Pseudomonadota bacterium]|jgi:hypothetical protein